MRGNRKEITLMLVPHANEPARRITIPKRLIHSMVALAFIFLIAFIFLAYRNISVGLDMVAYHRLQQENKLLLEEFHNTKNDIALLQANLKKLASFDNQIRIMAELPQIDDQTRLMGIGGPDLGENDPLGAIRERHGVGDIRANLDALVNQAKLQHDSFEKILDKIAKNQEAWRHTPSIRPIDGGILTSGFGMRKNPLTGKFGPHHGLDFAAPIGTPIYSTADGKVIFSGKRNGYGNVLEIDHGYGYHTYYAHNSINLANEGDEVKRGEIIARVGNSGRSTGPHVHYEVRLNGTPDNPARYILNDDLDSF